MVGIKDIHQQKLHALNVFPNHPLFIRSIQNISTFFPQTVMHCIVQYRHSVQQIYLRHKLYEQAIKIFSIKTIFASSKQNKQIIEIKKTEPTTLANPTTLKNDLYEEWGKAFLALLKRMKEKKEQIMTGWNISTQQICWKQKDKKIAKCAHKFQNSCIILFTSNISRGKEKSENKNKNNNMNWENAMNKQTHYTILKKNESNAALSLFHRSVFLSFDVNTFGCRNNVKNVRSGCKVFQLDLYYKLAMKNNTVSTVLECAFHLWKKKRKWMDNNEVATKIKS